VTSTQKFNEDSRVKVPALVHLSRLGYEYLSIADIDWDTQTNFASSIVLQQFLKLNPSADDARAEQEIRSLKDLLDNNDSGRSFFERLTSQGNYRYIDFDDFTNNALNIVTELPFRNGNEEFRPDITVLINGIPIAIIEVKIPNNERGIEAETKRMDVRFSRTAYKRFFNMLQLVLMSNNMDYNVNTAPPIVGSFLMASCEGAQRNVWREEESEIYQTVKDLNVDTEQIILTDNHLQNLKYQKNYQEALRPDNYTNQFLTSILTPKRLRFFLQFGLHYVRDFKDATKWTQHVIRYPQFFAAQAVIANRNSGAKRGIVWHTQGSGKTALTYYLTKMLSERSAQQGRVARFYFVVDRIDLLTQAKSELEARGLTVSVVEDRKDFVYNFTSPAPSGMYGELEITVVNIQKFDDAPMEIGGYNVEQDRYFFIDEAHRSWNPKGEFLHLLINSDPEAGYICLTGTPLLGEVATKKVFGPYFHKYFYDKSIADGFTLRLFREHIEEVRAAELKQIVEKLSHDLHGTMDSLEVRNKVLSHPSYVKALAAYVADDFSTSRTLFNEATIGALLVADSSQQARGLFQELVENHRELSVGLVLHDEEERGDAVRAFKAGSLDILIVFNMLLTGFDSPRLKKLYLGRVVRKHNLLQALTRVNRPFRDFKFGYVVDFADISEEFEKTTEMYWAELRDELGDDSVLDIYFVTPEEVEQNVELMQSIFFAFETEIEAIFSHQINELSDSEELLEMIRVLRGAREFMRCSEDSVRRYGAIGWHPAKVGRLLSLVERRQKLLTFLSGRAEIVDNAGIFDIELSDFDFVFEKVDAQELVLKDEFVSLNDEIRAALESNFDREDAQFVLAYESVQSLFRDLHAANSQEALRNLVSQGKEILVSVKSLNARNELLRQKYSGDGAYVRIHKRTMEAASRLREDQVYDVLQQVRSGINAYLEQNKNLQTAEGFLRRIIEKEALVALDSKNPELARVLDSVLTNNLMNEYFG